jgi:hypothetical protein
MREASALTRFIRSRVAGLRDGHVATSTAQAHNASGEAVPAGVVPALPDAATVIDADDAVRSAIVQSKATCPFIGPAVATGYLAIRHDPGNPLAAIDELRKLGNSGGGDLGDLLAFFASGNHALMRGESGRLDVPVPEGLFSLEFPGSQGSHPGHSGILQGDSRIPGSGRFSDADFERLAQRARNGMIARSDVGQFIAENMMRDPDAKVLGTGVMALVTTDLAGFVTKVGPALLDRLYGSPQEAAAAQRVLEQKLTKLLGEDNLVGSAGEFGLLFAFVANKPGSPEGDRDPAVSLEDVRTMFVHKQLPQGWDSWKKTRLDWVRNTTGLLLSAGTALLSLKRASG